MSASASSIGRERRPRVKHGWRWEYACVAGVGMCARDRVCVWREEGAASTNMFGYLSVDDALNRSISRGTKHARVDCRTLVQQRFHALHLPELAGCMQRCAPIGLQ